MLAGALWCLPVNRTCSHSCSSRSYDSVWPWDWCRARDLSVDGSFHGSQYREILHSPPLVDRAKLSLASAEEMRSLPLCSITLPAPSTLISIGCTTKFAQSASTKLCG